MLVIFDVGLPIVYLMSIRSTNQKIFSLLNMLNLSSMASIGTLFLYVFGRLFIVEADIGKKLFGKTILKRFKYGFIILFVIFCVRIISTVMWMVEPFSTMFLLFYDSFSKRPHLYYFVYYFSDALIYILPYFLLGLGIRYSSSPKPEKESDSPVEIVKVPIVLASEI